MKELLQSISNNIGVLVTVVASAGTLFSAILLGRSKHKKQKISIKIETDKIIMQHMSDLAKDLADLYKTTSDDKKIISFIFSNCPQCIEKVKDKYPEYFEKDE